MIEFSRWNGYETEREYLLGSKIAYVPLGEEAYGLIIVTPWCNIHLEEIPPYGGEPRYYGQYYGTIQEAIDFVKETFI